jgi:prolyl 4-hydroxylase
MYIILILSFLLILLILSISWKETFYDYDPTQFIHPEIYPNFITDNEVNYILYEANNFHNSNMVGNHYNENIRKSETCWLSKTDPQIEKIIQKVCDLTDNPIDKAEDLQVVKYQPNGFYNPHHDSCCEDTYDCKEFNKIGNRIVTMVIYLSNSSDFQGGATYFPKLKKEYKPEKGGGLLFYPMNKKRDKCHEKSLHAGQPVISGEKIICNVWIRS